MKNRLCCRFDNVCINFLVPLELKKRGLSPKVFMKPSFSMPFIKPPNMIPNIDEESI